MLDFVNLFVKFLFKSSKEEVHYSSGLLRQYKVSLNKQVTKTKQYNTKSV